MVWSRGLYTSSSHGGQRKADVCGAQEQDGESVNAIKKREHPAELSEAVKEEAHGAHRQRHHAASP